MSTSRTELIGQEQPEYLELGSDVYIATPNYTQADVQTLFASRLSDPLDLLQTEGLGAESATNLPKPTYTIADVIMLEAGLMREDKAAEFIAARKVDPNVNDLFKNVELARLAMAGLYDKQGSQDSLLE